MLNEELFDILGNRTRRQILRLLSGRPCFMTELSSELDVGQKAVNEHITALQRAGIIEMRIERQLRGRPRKYIQLSHSFSIESALEPSMLPSILGVAEPQKVHDAFSELFRQAESARAKRDLEELRCIAERSLSELRGLEMAEDAVKKRLARIHEASARMVSSFDLSEPEKRVLRELILSGGNESGIARHADGGKAVSALARRGLVAFDKSRGVWRIVP